MCIPLTAMQLSIIQTQAISLHFRSGEDDEKKIDHTGEPNKKRGKVQKKSMLSFDEDEEDEEYS